MKVSLIDAGKRFNRDWIFRHFTYNFEEGISYAITGPNGSGKSTLVMQELIPRLQQVLTRKKPAETAVAYVKNEHNFEKATASLKGYETIRDLVVIDQSPIGRTSRSTPATYLGFF